MFEVVRMAYESRIYEEIVLLLVDGSVFSCDFAFIHILGPLLVRKVLLYDEEAIGEADLIGGEAVGALDAS